MTNPTNELDLYDIDSLNIIYKLLAGDSALETLLGGNNKIYKYHVPEEFRSSPPIIRISPISELPTGHADNMQLAWDCILQIDVWDTANSRKIALRIHELMKNIKFVQSTPTFDFDPETYLIRDGRRYRGVLISNKKENK